MHTHLLFLPDGCTLGLLLLLLATSLGVLFAPTTRLALLVLSQNIRQQLPLALLTSGRSRGPTARPGLGLLLAGPVHIAAHVAGIVQRRSLALLPAGARTRYIHLLGRHGPEQEFELSTLELLLVLGAAAGPCGSSGTRRRILLCICPRFGLSARAYSGRWLLVAIVIPTRRSQTSNLLGS